MEIDRRNLLKILGGMVVATAGGVLIPYDAESATVLRERQKVDSDLPEEFFRHHGTTKREILEIVNMSEYSRGPAPFRDFDPRKVSFYPRDNPFVFVGNASYYTTKESGRITATGAPFVDDLPTIAINPRTRAHLPSLVKLTNLEEEGGKYGKSILAVANDRGPYYPKRLPKLVPHPDRIVDLSQESKRCLGFDPEQGTYRVRLEVIESYEI